MSIYPGGCTNLMRLRHRLLGLQPADDIDAISYRTNDLALGALDTHGMYDSLMRAIHWHFSVDQQSQGVGGTAVSNEVTAGTASCGVPVVQLPEACGDIFVTSVANGIPTPSPPTSPSWGFWSNCLMTI